jgi:hypothetical protein
MPSIAQLTCGAALLVAGSARADLVPMWIAEQPVGSALAAGLRGMTTSPAGVSYLTGNTGPSSNTDAITMAVGADGQTLWQHVFNGPANWHDQARGIALGPQGVLYVTGNTPGPGSYAQVLLLTYETATGALLDSLQYSSAPFTSEYGASVVTDPQGNVYVGGGTVGDGGDGLILSFDASGAFRWKNVYDGPALAPYSQDQVLQLALDPAGDLVALIHGVMGSLHPDYVVIKYAPADGSILWQVTWGVSGEDSPRDMEIDAEGDVYVTGTGINFNDRFSTIKLRGTDGALLWQAYDWMGAHDSAAALALDGAGGVCVTGASDPDGDHSNFNDNFYTVKRDAATGALVWTHAYGANCVGCYDVPADVRVDPAGNVFVAGSTSSPPYGNDMILFALDGATGIEIDRGVVDPGVNQTDSAGVLRLDGGSNLLIGGRRYHANTGAVSMTVTKYASMAGANGDVNQDGAVTVADLVEVVLAWGQCPSPPAACPADVTGDGMVDVADLVAVVLGWS